MEGIGARLLVAGLAVAGLFTTGASAQVQPAPSSPYTPSGNMPTVAITRVASGSSGVTIYIQVRQTDPGSAAVAAASEPSAGGGGGGGPVCAATPANIGNAAFGSFQLGAAAHPGSIPYALYCDGIFQSIVWLAAATDPAAVQVAVEGGGGVDPMTLARSLLSRIPLPPITIGVSPSTGLVALPSWFWVSGYDGAPITAAASLSGVTVEVTLTPDGYTWQFGDGADLVSATSGRPYPEPSDVAHTYEQSSLRAGGAYAVALAITFRVQVRVNGGAVSDLPPIRRDYAAAYPVQQVQAVLTSR